nr:PREDICTED: RING finger protein 212B-like isoform X1 [Bemisia tabaci]
MNVIHCNKCGIFPEAKKSTKFFITNCGHLLCERCKGSDTCCICRNQCNKLLISEEMPSHVKDMLFEDLMDQMDHVYKLLQFRTDHFKKRLALASEMFLKYEKLKESYLKLTDDNKKVKTAYAKLMSEYKKRDAECKELKQAAQSHKKAPALKHALDSGAQSRAQPFFNNPKLSVVTPRKCNPLFKTPTSLSPFRTMNRERHPNYRNPAQYSGSSVGSAVRTPASDFNTPSSSVLSRFNERESNNTARSPFVTPEVPIQDLKLGSWHGLRPKKPF